MSVIRIHKNKDFTVMGNLHFREKEMSLKAKGLLSLMLSLPNDWNYSIRGLCSIVSENETAVKSALKELQKFGYLKIKKINPSKSKSGRYEYEYDIYENKVIEQECEKQGIEKQGIENQPLEILPIENQLQVNTKESNIEEARIEHKTTKDKQQKNRKESFDFLISDFTSNSEVIEAINGFLEMRKMMKKEPTKRALQLILEKLKPFSDEEIIGFLDASVLNSWVGVYTEKKEYSSTKPYDKNSIHKDYTNFENWGEQK